MKKHSTILEAAKEYVKQGFSVIPIRNGEKAPAIEWEPYQKRRATEQELDTWFSNTDHQIGIVTGLVSSGRFILDFDGEKWCDGFESAITAFPELQETLMSQTGSGKVHAYATCVTMPPDITKIIYKHPCGKNEKGKVKFDYQIELRCNEHQTLCPPSKHPSGGSYSWVDESKPLIAFKRERFDELTRWVTHHEDGAKVESDHCNKEWVEVTPKKALPQEEWDEILKGVPDGNRNTQAARLCGHYISKRLTDTEILPILRDWDGRNDPPLGDKVLQTTLESVRKKDTKEHPERYKESARKVEKYSLPTSKEGIESFWGSLPTFLDVEEDATDEWLVDLVIPYNAITCFYGKAGLGKSHVVYGHGLAVQSGNKWFGHDVKKMDVLYLDYEMTENRRGHIKKACGSGAVKLWATVTPDKSLPPPPQIDGDSFETLKGFPPCFIIVDTLRAATSMNIQDDTEAAKLMNKLKELCAVGHTVVILLHTLKLNDRQWKGNQVIMDLSDHCLGLFKVKSKGDTTEDTSEDDDPNEPKLLFFGTLPDDKSRYPKQKTYLTFDPSNVTGGAVILAPDPKKALFEQGKQILINYIDSLQDKSDLFSYPNITTFISLLAEEQEKGGLGIGVKKARKLVVSGAKLKVWGTDSVKREKGKSHDYYFPMKENW